MTDQEQLKAMFDKAGVVHEDDEKTITVTALTGPKNFGYNGFYAAFSFNDDGALDSTSVYED